MVSVVVVTYNGIQWLGKSLASIPKIYNIIVVDNNSDDDSITFITTEYPKIKVIPLSENLGFGVANNIGISCALKSGAEFVFLLNQDAYLRANTIELLLKIQIENPNYGILSPIHLNGTGNKLDLNFSRYISKVKDNLLYSDYVLNRELKTIYDINFVNAAGWLVSKKCLMKVGGFDPKFFLYGEDDNFCHRVLFHEFKIGVVPDCFMLHDRENRKNKAIKLGSEEYFQWRRRQFLIEFANPNTRPEDLNLKKNKIKKTYLIQFLRSFLKFKFIEFKFILRDFEVFNESVRQAEKSRELHKIKKAHYLNV